MNKAKFLDARNILAQDFPLEEIIGHMSSGGVIIHPTETVYGFGGIPHVDVTDKIALLKDRTPRKPMLLLVPDKKSTEGLEWTPEALILADAFWPGPLTIVLSDKNVKYPKSVRNATGGVGVRVSPHPIVSILVKELGGPMVSTSANISGEQPLSDATRIVESKHLSFVQDLLILDIGPLPHSLPSTVIDCSKETLKILRRGAISFRQIERLFPGGRLHV